MDRQTNIFVETISRFKNTKRAKDLISDIKDQIKLQRIDGMVLDPEKLKKKHQTISKKYQKGIFVEKQQMWNEGQRKVYLNFLLAYCYLHFKKIHDIVPPFLKQSISQWNRISLAFHSKRIFFLKYQAKNLQKNTQRVHWNNREQAILQYCIKNEINGNWAAISYALFIRTEAESFKTPKQCRQHWFNHLNKDIKKGKWTIDQDIKILDFVAQNGRHWSKITQLLNGVRTQHMIKNRFSTLINMGKKYCNSSQAINNTQTNIIKIILQYLNKNRDVIYQLNSESGKDNLQLGHKSLVCALPGQRIEFDNQAKFQQEQINQQNVDKQLAKREQRGQQLKQYRKSLSLIDLNQQKNILTSNIEPTIKIEEDHQKTFTCLNQAIPDKQIEVSEQIPYMVHNSMSFNLAPISYNIKLIPYYNSFLPLGSNFPIIYYLDSQNRNKSKKISEKIKLFGSTQTNMYEQHEIQ